MCVSVCVRACACISHANVITYSKSTSLHITHTLTHTPQKMLPSPRLWFVPILIAVALISRLIEALTAGVGVEG